jgi:hypothetical protein
VIVVVVVVAGGAAAVVVVVVAVVAVVPVAPEHRACAKRWSPQKARAQSGHVNGKKSRCPHSAQCLPMSSIMLRVGQGAASPKARRSLCPRAPLCVV